MTITDWLLVAILVMLIIDYIGEHTTWRRIRANVPYWIKKRINELRNR